MREWGVWDWVAYSALWTAALILAADSSIKSTELLKDQFHFVINSLPWTFSPLILVIFGTCTLFLNSSRKRRPSLEVSQPHYVETASLELKIFPDDQVAHRISASNVGRWYVLKNIFIPIGPDGIGKKSILPNLFVTFEPPIRAGTLEITSPDAHLPSYEVKQFTDKFSIVAFSGDFPNGTLVMRVRL